MTDALRYLIILTGYAFWVACLGFFLIGCYACARQALADRAMRKAESDAEDADYAALRTEGMGDVRAVPDAGVGDVWQRHYEHTPVYDQLAAECPEVAARWEATALDDEAAIREWIRGTRG